MNKNGSFLLVEKPKGLTSFDVVRRLRKIFSCKKVGHAGTLDPHAEGLLICAFGVATRLFPFLEIEPKSYEFILQFGTQTDTLDATGSVVEDGGKIPDIEEVATALQSFHGKQMQIPPAFSALKIGGVRAYKLARTGQIPQMQQREITIHSLSLIDYDSSSGKARLMVRCSGGTYVRSLARDIARHAGTFGHAASIRRIACGPFHLAKAHALEDINSLTEHLTIHEALAGIPCLSVDSALMRDVAYGRDIDLEHIREPHSGIVMLFNGEELVAVLSQVQSTTYHPTQVFVLPERKPREAA